MKLFEQTKIGQLKLKNRIFMAPMGTFPESNGSYTIDGINYFEERAKGGAGLIITGANEVSSKYEVPLGTTISLFSHVERLSTLIDRCHHHGAKVCVQLSPGSGRMLWADLSTIIYSAGDCCSFFNPEMKCRPLLVEQIHDLVNSMENAAVLAKSAGADAIELHGYGGYMFDQFMTSLWNNRTDEYGGSLKNRMRFPLECLEAIKRGAGKDFPVFMKYSAIHGIPGGREISEGVEIAKMLEASGLVDALHIDIGCYEVWYRGVSTVYGRPANQMEYASIIKQNVSLPVLGQGKLLNPVYAEGALMNGDVDFVGLGHQMLADPYWPAKVKDGRIDDIIPCIGCNECLQTAFTGKRFCCAVNPLCYAEKDYILTPSDVKKSVLVVGGGPGGMQAALAGAKRGLEVELWEKSDRLGGNLWAAGLPSFKNDVLKLIKYFETQLHKAHVTVRLLKEACAEEVIQRDFDEVILATGSAGLMPSIKGIEMGISATDVLSGKVKPGKRAVVIGGGLVGCEAAAYMKETADEVTIIEMLDDILAGSEHCLNNDQALRNIIHESEVRIIAGAKATEIRSSSLTYEKDNNVETIPCDSVIIAAGFKPNNSLEGELAGKVKSLTVVGDAESPRKIINAIHEGYHAVRCM